MDWKVECNDSIENLVALEFMRDILLDKNRVIRKIEGVTEFGIMSITIPVPLDKVDIYCNVLRHALGGVKFFLGEYRFFAGILSVLETKEEDGGSITIDLFPYCIDFLLGKEFLQQPLIKRLSVDYFRRPMGNGNRRVNVELCYSGWFNINGINNGDLPDCTGIYVFGKHGKDDHHIEIVYVGKSVNLRSRIANHKVTRIGRNSDCFQYIIPRFIYYPCPFWNKNDRDYALSWLEYHFIINLNPLMNKYAFKPKRHNSFRFDFDVSQDFGFEQL